MRNAAWPDLRVNPQGGVALSLMYTKYTTLSAPCPAKKWSMAMGIRIVLTGPGDIQKKSIRFPSLPT